VTASSAPPEPGPAPPHGRPCDCPVATAEAALWLLASGRPDMAQRVLEGLPRLLLEAENVRLKARVVELEDWLAQRRALQDQLARLAPETTELEE